MCWRASQPRAAKRRTHTHAARDRTPTKVRWARRSGHAWVGVHAGCAAYSQPHTLPPHTVPSRPSMATTSPSPSTRASCWPKSSLMCPVSFDCGMTPTPWCRACKIRRGQLSVDWKAVHLQRRRGAAVPWCHDSIAGVYTRQGGLWFWGEARGPPTHAAAAPRASKAARKGQRPHPPTHVPPTHAPPPTLDFPSPNLAPLVQRRSSA